MYPDYDRDTNLVQNPVKKPCKTHETRLRKVICLGSPVEPFYPFSFWVPLLKPNSRKKGTLIVKGLLGNLDVYKADKTCLSEGHWGTRDPKPQPWQFKTLLNPKTTKHPKNPKSCLSRGHRGPIEKPRFGSQKVGALRSQFVEVAWSERSF